MTSYDCDECLRNKWNEQRQFCIYADKDKLEEFSFPILDEYGDSKGRYKKVYFDNPDELLKEVIDEIEIKWPSEPLFEIMLKTFQKVCPVGYLDVEVDKWLEVSADVKNLGAESVFGKGVIPGKMRAILREIESTRNYYQVNYSKKKEKEQ